MVLFAFNPYVVMIVDLDRNVMALAFAAALYFLAVNRSVTPVLLGALAGFTVGLGLNLLPLVFGVPLAFHVVSGSRRPWLDLGLFLCPFLLVGATWLGYIGLDTSQGWVEPFHYSLLGVEFSSHRLLAYPFVSGLTRGPHDAFPPMLEYPLHVANTLGVVLVGLALLGLAVNWRSSWRSFGVLMLWGIPSYAVLAMQAVTMEEDQARIIVTGLLPVLLLSAMGACSLCEVDRLRPRLIGLSALSLTVALLVWATSFLGFPVDDRVRDMRFIKYTIGVDEVERRLAEGAWEDPFGAADAKRTEEMRRAMRFALPVPNFMDSLASSRARLSEAESPWHDVSHQNLWQIVEGRD